MSPSRAQLLLLAVPVVMSACTVQPVVVERRPAPPAPRVEVVGVAPYTGAHWVRGHWGWRHGRWEWIPGHWSRRYY